MLQRLRLQPLLVTPPCWRPVLGLLARRHAGASDVAGPQPGQVPPGADRAVVPALPRRRSAAKRERQRAAHTRRGVAHGGRPQPGAELLHCQPVAHGRVDGVQPYLLGRYACGWKTCHQEEICQLKLLACTSNLDAFTSRTFPVAAAPTSLCSYQCPRSYLTHLPRPVSHITHATTHAGACMSSVGLAANDPNLFQYGIDIYTNKFLQVVRPDGTLPSVRGRCGSSSTTAADGVRLKGLSWSTYKKGVVGGGG